MKTVTGALLAILFANQSPASERIPTASKTSPFQIFNSTVSASEYLTHRDLSSINHSRGPNPLNGSYPGPLVLSTGADSIETDILINSENGGIELSSYDGGSSFKLGGLMMFDSAHFNRSGMGDGAEIRRLRLEADGHYAFDWEYALSVDFAGDEADVKNAYLQYIGLQTHRLRFGQFKQPFGLEALTGSRYLTFTERALPDVLVPSRALGLATYTHGSHWGLAGGIFREELNKEAEDEVDQGWSITGRAHIAPQHEERRVIHFGLGLSYQSLAEGDFLRYKQDPESRLSSVDILDTGKTSIDQAEHVLKTGVELASVNGPFSIQGEWINASLSQRDESPDLDFTGWYLLGSWFITGESRHYKFNKGAFGRVRPLTHNGAVELALRYSELNLNHSDIDGGKEQNISLGINWYITSHIRIMGNYIRVNYDEKGQDNADFEDNQEVDILQIRMQAYF